MAFKGQQISVTSAAVKLVDASKGSVIDTVPAVVTNQDSSVSVFLGGSDVTTAGYELKAGSSVPIACDGGDDLWAVTASATVRVDVLRGRV